MVRGGVQIRLLKVQSNVNLNACKNRLQYFPFLITAAVASQRRNRYLFEEVKILVFLRRPITNPVHWELR